MCIASEVHVVMSVGWLAGAQFRLAPAASSIAKCAYTVHLPTHTTIFSSFSWRIDSYKIRIYTNTKKIVFFWEKAMGYVCPQWPDRCCFCFTKRLGVIVTGLAFCLLDLSVILLCGYTLFFNSNIWDKGKKCFEFLF